MGTYEIFAVVRDCLASSPGKIIVIVEIATVDFLQTCSVEVDAVGMHVVGMLVLIVAAGGEIDHAGLLIDLKDVFHMPRPFGNCIFQGAVGVVEI